MSVNVPLRLLRYSAGNDLPGASRPVHRVDEQDVLPSVAVGIEKEAAGAKRLRQIFLSECAAVVDEPDAGPHRDVRKRDGRSGRHDANEQDRDNRQRDAPQVNHWRVRWRLARQAIPDVLDRRPSVLVNLLPLVVVVRAISAGRDR